MGKFASVLILAVALAAVMVSCTTTAVDNYFNDPTRLERQRQQTALNARQREIEIAEQSRQAEGRAEFWQTIKPFVYVGAALVVLVAALGASAGVGILLAYWWDSRQKARFTYRADSRGMWPVSQDALDQAALLAGAGYHQAQIAAANQPQLPINLRTYQHAPRYVEGRQAAPSTAPSITVERSAPPSLAAPSFAGLLESGQVGRGQLLLGYTTDGPLVGSWKDLYSTAVGGVSGSGKTNTTRFLAAQSAMLGARFVIIDPHADAGDDSLAATLSPLAPTFITDPATDTHAIRAVAQLVNAELDRRMADGVKSPPLIVAVDEFTSLMRSTAGADLGALVERIGQEGRKYGIFALLSGQIWTAERSGGSELRDSLASAFVHRLKPSQARLLVPDIGKDVARLPTGTAYLNRTSGDLVQVAIPLTTATDLERVGRQVQSVPLGGLGRSDGARTAENAQNQGQNTVRPRPTATDRPPLRVVRPVGLTDQAARAGVELTQEQWADLAAIDQGETPQAIAARETNTTEGRPYRRRRDELIDLANMIRNWPIEDRAAEGDAEGHNKPGLRRV